MYYKQKFYVDLCFLCFAESLSFFIIFILNFHGRITSISNSIISELRIEQSTITKINIIRASPKINNVIGISPLSNIVTYTYIICTIKKCISSNLQIFYFFSVMWQKRIGKFSKKLVKINTSWLFSQNTVSLTKQSNLSMTKWRMSYLM